MSSNLQYATALTPKPGAMWQQAPDSERLESVKKAMASNAAFPSNIITAVEAKADGQVIVRLHAPVSADKRGTLLLDLEDFLKATVDSGLAVWLEPLGDRSSLRNLRGIEVK